MSPVVRWYRADVLWPAHAITSRERVAAFIMSMNATGWQGEALVGYYTQERRMGDVHIGIQLLNGPHRQAAASFLGVAVPVIVVPEMLVEHAWGFPERWKRVMDRGAEQLCQS